MDNDQPLISAIIIFLNEEKFLKEAIVSVIGTILHQLGVIIS